MVADAGSRLQAASVGRRRHYVSAGSPQRVAAARGGDGERRKEQGREQGGAYGVFSFFPLLQ